jgi:hypothetical protein
MKCGYDGATMTLEEKTARAALTPSDFGWLIFSGAFGMQTPAVRALWIEKLREAFCLACGCEHPERGNCQCENDE